ncbi:MAG: permease, partial [Verrucomicrobiota bacterium]
MESIGKFMQALWFTWFEMAPFLLVGFLIAGVLHAFLDKDRVLRLLGKDGPMQTVRAVVLGIPIPVCSCGVIPIAATLREKGAGPGATSGFMLTTPQTGIDSIYATAGILGGPLAAVRVLAALVSGIAAGIAAQRFSGQSVVNKGEQAEIREDACCGESSHNEGPQWTHKIDDGLRFGLVTLPKDVFWPIIIGVVIAALAQAFLPTNLWGALEFPLWAGYLFVIAISLPVYVCSTGASISNLISAEPSSSQYGYGPG